MYRQHPRSTRTDTLLPYPPPLRAEGQSRGPQETGPQGQATEPAARRQGAAQLHRPREPHPQDQGRFRSGLQRASRRRQPRPERRRARSEEHTSEPQSLMRTSYALFSLNKKNRNDNNQERNRF